ncbi:MAG: ParB/RepB/Spo0J family partition protein, partial [Planctomycetota bacterium]|nr:ParB/RepB/Spo0J family partition protein [Planctomycetota bacterium]
YQARKKMDRTRVRALADEIREAGLWPGSLRGRMKGEKVELCYGHRRLAAIRMLGWAEVDVEIEDLNDEEMALQSLAENFQREGLTDIEKAMGIQVMLDQYRNQNLSNKESIRRVAKFVGLSEAWIRDLLSLLKMEKPVQRAIRNREIAGRTALEAHRFGGKQMVETAMNHSLPVHKISAIAQRVRKIPDEKIRIKLKEEVLRGKMIEPEKLEERARKLMKGKKVSPPEDMERILSDWNHILNHWNEKSDELLMYKRFFASTNKAAVGKVKRQSAKLIRRLQKLI